MFTYSTPLRDANLNKTKAVVNTVKIIVTMDAFRFNSHLNLGVGRKALPELLISAHVENTRNMKITEPATSVVL